MSTAVKLGTGELLFELLPASKFPCKYFEFFNIVTQIWHVFGGKGLICETDNELIMSGPKVNYALSLTDTGSSMSIGGAPLTFSSSVSMSL
jgi:hypothetical protein